MIPERLESARGPINESRALIAWSLARILTQRHRTMGHPSLTELTAFLEALDSPCDLDVLMFFHRHPRVFLTTADLAQAIGYDRAEIDRSIKGLIRARLVKSVGPGREATARLYELTPGRWVDLLSRLLWVASTPDGRRALIRALRHHRDR